MSPIARGWQLYRKHFGVILGLVLCVAAPCQLLLNYLTHHVFARDDVAAVLQAHALLTAIPWILLSGSILQALFVDHLGRKAGVLECLSTGLTNAWQLAWTYLLILGLIFTGTLFFILPGLIALVRLSLASTIVIIEGEWGLSALKRSIQLTADRSWAVIGLSLFLYLLLILAWLVVRMLLTNPALDDWLIASGLGVLLELAGCLIPVCFFCLYESLIAADTQEM